MLLARAGGRPGALDLDLAREAAVAGGWAFVLVEQPWLVAGRRIAGPPPTLDAAWLPMVAALLTGRGRLPRPLVVGGRSAGARVACRTAAELEPDAALLLSFPLHPPAHPTGCGPTSSSSPRRRHGSCRAARTPSVPRSRCAPTRLRARR